MALPSVVGRHMPPIRTSPLQALAAGVPAAGFSYGSPAGQQTSLMMGVGADGMCRRATYPGCISAGNQLGGAAGLTGCGSHLTIDGSVGHFDTTLLNTLGYNAANMHTAAIPAQWVSFCGGTSSLRDVTVLCCIPTGAALLLNHVCSVVGAAGLHVHDSRHHGPCPLSVTAQSLTLCSVCSLPAILAALCTGCTSC